MNEPETALTLLGLTAASGDLVKIVLGGVGGALLKPIAEGVLPGLVVWKDQQIERRRQLVVEAAVMVDGSGGIGTVIPGGILFKVLEHSDFTEDHELRTKYAALLANTSLKPGAILPAFVGILGELSPPEVRILDAVARFPQGDYNTSLVQSRIRSVQGSLTVGQLRLGITNLDRLNLATSDLTPPGLDPLTDEEFLGRRIMLTRFGRAFVDSCTPPSRQT
jgi:hypothetical protein